MRKPAPRKPPVGKPADDKLQGWVREAPNYTEDGFTNLSGPAEPTREKQLSPEEWRMLLSEKQRRLASARQLAMSAQEQRRLAFARQLAAMPAQEQRQLRRLAAMPAQELQQLLRQMGARLPDGMSAGELQALLRRALSEHPPPRSHHWRTAFLFVLLVLLVLIVFLLVT